MFAVVKALNRMIVFDVQVFLYDLICQMPEMTMGMNSFSHFICEHGIHEI